MTEPKWNYCGEKDCPVTRKHWHCVSCGEPCEVGDEECEGCWQAAREMERGHAVGGGWGR